MYLRERERERKRERERGREDSREPDVPAALLLKSDGRRWRTLRANLFSQGKRPCLVVDGVRARRWRWWYDQVIPLSELSVARGYLQSVFPFWSPVSPSLTSLCLASPRFASPRVSSRPRDLTEMSIRERAFSLAAQTFLWETLLFSHATPTVGYIFAHFGARRLSSLQLRHSPLLRMFLDLLLVRILT